MSSSSLYGNNPTVTSNDTTSLYGASSSAQVPNANGDLLVKGNLAVDGGNITTTSAIATVFNTNATTLSIGGAATSLNLGASTGTTSINNNGLIGGNLTVDGNEIVNGSLTSVGTGTFQSNVIISGPLQVNNSGTFTGAVTAADGIFGNIQIAPGGNNNLISTSTGDLQIQPTTGNIVVKPATNIEWAESSNRTNRLNFKSTNGTTSGIRVVAPVATGGQATSSVITTNDINNTQFVNLSANQAAANPLRIQTGSYSSGVLGPSGTVLTFIDNVTTYATINPAGPTNPLDLTTKAYVDSHDDNTTYTIDSSITTGGANFNLRGRDASVDTIKFAGTGGTTVTSTDANTITINSATSDHLQNGSYAFTLNADGTVTTPSQINTGNAGPLTLVGQTGLIGYGSTVLDSNSASLYASGGVTSTDGKIKLTSTSAQIDLRASAVHTTWNFNNDGSTGFPHYTFPSADGTLNQILVSNGAGVLSWQDNNASTNQLVNGPYSFTLDASGSLVPTLGDNVNIFNPDGLGNSSSWSVNPTGTMSFVSTQDVGHGGSSMLVNYDQFSFTRDADPLNFPVGIAGSWSFNGDGTTSLPSYTLPYADGSVNQVLKTDGAGTLSWYTPVDTNTTYTYTAGSTTGGANLTLTGSDATTNTVKVASGTGITVAQNSSTQITVTNSGVTSAVAGTGIGVSAATGAVTFSNTGVTSLAAGTYLSVNASTGAVTISTNATSANTASTIVARDASGNFSAGTITANTSNGNYVLGQEYFTRNSSWTPPPNSLTSLDGNNGIAIGSSAATNGYSPQIQLVYSSGDTTAGTNASAAIVTRGSAGTTASPSAIATNQVAGTWNFDGYATSGWASAIATTGSGAGTTSIQPLQVQGYAVSAFTDSAGTVTNAPMGFRVRGFAASTNLSTANRVNFIDHTVATATYKAGTFNIQNSANTTNYASFVSSGSTFTAVSGVGLFIRQDTNNTTQPVAVLRHQRTDTTGANDGDGTDFRLGVGGTSTNTNIGRFDSVYKSSTLHEIGMATSTDSFATNTTRVYVATADTTKIQCTPASTPSGSLVTVAQFTQAATTLKTNAITLQTAAGVNLVGSAVTYNRVYGQWQYDTTVTPGAANTAAVFPLGTADVNNIATVGSTSRLIPGASGAYNLQFSVQCNNADNGSDHVAYVWLRKNGTDVAGTMGRITVVKNSATIGGWNYVVSSANTTDYFELAYAVDSTQVTFPFYASTSFGPSTAALITTLTPVGM